MANLSLQKVLRLPCVSSDESIENVSTLQQTCQSQPPELISLHERRTDEIRLDLKEGERMSESLLSNRRDQPVYLEVERLQDLKMCFSELTLKHTQRTLLLESYEAEFRALRNIVEEIMRTCEKILQDQTLGEQIENYKRTVDTLKAGLCEMQSQLSKNEKQNSQLQDKVIELATKKEALGNVLTTMKLEIEHWRTEQTLLMKTCLEKEIQLEESHHQVVELEQKLQVKSDKILSLADKFKLDTNTLAKDQAISRLKWELKETRSELSALTLEFKTYKTEYKRQLDDEKQLNMRHKSLQTEVMKKLNMKHKSLQTEVRVDGSS